MLLTFLEFKVVGESGVEEATVSIIQLIAKKCEMELKLMHTSYWIVC